MFCEKCEKQISDNAKFCPYCGQGKNIKEEILSTNKESKNKKSSAIIKFIIGISVFIVVIIAYVLIIMPNLQDNKLKDCLEDAEAKYKSSNSIFGVNAWNRDKEDCYNTYK